MILIEKSAKRSRPPLAAERIADWLDEWLDGRLGGLLAE